MRHLVTLGWLLCALALTPTAQAFSGVTLPRGWTRAPAGLTRLTVPTEAYAAASFPLGAVPPGECGPSAAARAQMPPNSLIVIVESWGQVGQHSLYRPLGRHVDLGHAAAMECSGWSYNVLFRAGNEDLQAAVIVRGHPGARRLDEARHLLASIRP